MIESLRQFAPKLLAILGVALLAGYLFALHRTDPPTRLFASIEQFDDPRATLGIGQVLDAPWQPSRPDVTGDYDGTAHWFRIRLHAPPEPGNLVIEVSPATLDDVTFYLPGNRPGSWQVLRSGMQVPYLQRDSRLVTISAEIPSKAVPGPIYMRMQSGTSTTMALGVDTVKNAYARQDRLIALHIVYFGFLGMGMFLSLLRLFEQPSALSLSLFAFLASYFATSLLALGYGPVLVDPPVSGFHAKAYMLVSLTTVLLSMLFQRVFFMRQSSHEWLRLLFDLVIFLQAMLLVALAMGHRQVAGMGTAACALAFLLLLMIQLATLQGGRRSHRRILIVAYCLYAGVAGFWMLTRIGLVGDGADTRHFIEIFGLDNLFLALIIARLDRDAQEEQQRATVLSLEAAQSARASRARNAKMQDGFLQMLMHEVRNQLSVLRMGLPALTDMARKRRIATLIDQLNHRLAKAQHMIWLAQGTWPNRMAQVPIVEALDAVIDRLDLASEVHLQGEAAEATVRADRTLLDAVLTYTLLAASILPADAGGIAVDISQPDPAGPCTIEVQVPLMQDGLILPDRPDSDLDLAKRLALAMKARLVVRRRGTRMICLTLRLPP